MIQSSLSQEMEQSSLFNGEIIKPGDIVEVKYGPYTSFTKVILYGGKLCLYEQPIFGKNVAIDIILKPGNLCRINKATQKTVYLFCKRYNWDSHNLLKKLNEINL